MTPERLGTSLGLCAVCQDTVSKSIIEGKKKIWRQLPELFGLSDWATLKARDDSDGWSKLPELPDRAEYIVVRERYLAIDD